MELRQLRYFTRVAETLHFGEAARLEYVAKSVISAQIAALERDLGFALFDRTSRQVTLTPAGEAFLVDSQRTLAELRLAAEQARAFAHRQRSTFRVGVFGEGAGPLTHLILSAFATARPDVRIQYVELSMVDALENVLNRVVDVALLRLPVDDPRVHVDPLFFEPRVAVMPASHELADAASITVEDLLDQPFAVAADGAPHGWRSYWSFDSERGEASRIGAEVRSIAESLATIAYAGAVDTFPSTAVALYPHSGVRYVQLDDAEPSCLALVTLTSRMSDDMTQQFRRITAAVTDRHLALIPGATRASA